MKETRYIAYFVTEEDLFMPKEAFLSYEEAARELEAFLAEVSGDYGVEYKEQGKFLSDKVNNLLSIKEAYESGQSVEVPTPKPKPSAPRPKNISPASNDEPKGRKYIRSFKDENGNPVTIEGRIYDR